MLTCEKGYWHGFFLPKEGGKKKNQLPLTMHKAECMWQQAQQLLRSDGQMELQWAARFGLQSCGT